MLKTVFKLNKKNFFEVDPKKWANLTEKEKEELILGENFKYFAMPLTVFEPWQFDFSLHVVREG